jgi:hypothetical protein
MVTEVLEPEVETKQKPAPPSTEAARLEKACERIAIYPPPVTTGKQVADEMAKIPFEPFLPVEAKLVTWSLVLGVGLLAILVWVSNTFFAH